MNSFNFVGRTTKKPELSYTPTTQTAVAKFTIAVDRERKRDGEQNADFIRITVFGKSAENCNRYLDKGRLVAVKGRVSTGSYPGQDGKTVYTTDFIADSVEFLGGSGKSQNDNQGNYGDAEANLPPAMQQENIPPQANNVPPANNMPPAGDQVSFQEMPADDEPW